MRRALLVVGKPPTPGYTKTRLLPLISAAAAAELYRGFLLDSVQLGLGLGWERVCVVHPRDNRQAMASLLPPGVALLEQPGDGLGDALSSAFRSTLADGFARVVLIGSDTPTLPAQLIEEAGAALDNYDLSIGPSADGGYYLMGMGQPHLGVFEGIDWSTSRVYCQTLTRAEALGLRVHALQEWYDVDEPADVSRLQRELDAAAQHVAPNTRAALERIGSLAATG
jgi:rSAM/selenodomain-associated transferase 1